MPATVHQTQDGTQAEYGQLTHEQHALLFPLSSKLSFPRSVFRLTRLLRHNLKLLLGPEEPIIRDIVCYWMTHAKNVYPSDLVIEDHIVSLIQDQWQLARWPLGFMPLEDACKRAVEHKTFPLCPPKYGECHYTVYRAVYQLNLHAIRNGEQTFWASTHELARFLSINQSVVHQAVKRMERDGIFKVAERGTPHGNGRRGRATHYLCTLS